MENNIYKYDEKVSLGECLPISLQHVLAMLIGNVAPALLVAQAASLDNTSVQVMVSAAMLCAAIATAIQVFTIGSFGSRLPMVMGLNFAFVPIAMNVVANQGLATIFPAMVCGGIVQIILGQFLNKIEKFFPPLVTGITVTTMGISLYPVAINYMAGGVGTDGYGDLANRGIAIFTLILVLVLSGRKGFVGVNAMLIGIIGGYILAAILGRVDFTQISSSKAFALPKFLPFGFKFDLSVVMTFVIMYIVTVVENIGDTSSLTIGGFNRTATTEELSGSIKGNGLASIITAFLGGLPAATFSQNVGIVSITKAINRRIIKLAAGIIFISAFLPKFAALMASIPYPVLGGATLSVFAIITVNGMKLLSKVKLTSKSMTIIGISLALGVGISQVPEAIAGFPQAFQTFFASSPVIISTLVAFILNIVMKEDENEVNTEE
jgi:xanthine permease